VRKTRFLSSHANAYFSATNLDRLMGDPMWHGGPILSCLALCSSVDAVGRGRTRAVGPREAISNLVSQPSTPLPEDRQIPVWSADPVLWLPTD